MNLLLHGVDAPDIHYQDTLSNNFPERFPAQAANCFDVILANPPFKGSLDYADVHPSLLAKVKTKKTELLFVALILRMLKLGGRSATIVPSALSKTDPPVLSKSDPGILTEPRPPRLRDDDESSRCQRPGRDHARSAAGGSDRIRG
jgi:hypothetical protein